jgi:hypothetical protein
MARVLIAGGFVGTAANTISSCGTASDHLKIKSITTDADAHGGPRKGKPFTITLEGDLDEAHQHGVVSGDLHLTALELVDIDLGPWNQKYDFLPGLAKGSTKVQIGPFTFPRSVPGKLSLDGKVIITNHKAEQVTCLDLALLIPAILEEEEDSLGAGGDTCGDVTKDHITNVQSETVDDVTTSTMDLDEELDYVNLKLDLTLKAPLVPAVTVKLTELPVGLSPGLPAGQLKFVEYPSDSAKSNDIIDVTGSLILEDKNGEEVVCITFSDDATAVSV